MFENLSDREKKLLLAIGTLVPIAIVFLGFLSMQSAYNTNRDQIQALKLQIVEQKEIEEKGALADRRQAYYANTSLPPDTINAVNNYQRDIRAMMEKSELTVTNVKPTGGSKVQSGGEEIGQSKQIKVSASGTLAQFNDFLTKFYQLDMLHRITDISLKPENDLKSRNKLTRNGKITSKLTFEVLSLKTGLNRDSFDEFRTHLADAKKDYTDILRRDIFGPKNSEPVVTAGRKTHMIGKEFSTFITATDANKNDMLTFELVESSVEGATLTQTKPGERRARFKMPDVEQPGTYKFGIKVSDNGYPSKFSIEELVVTVNAPKPKKVAETKTSKPPPEEVDYIQLVKVTGITSDRNGTRHVWVSLGPPTGKLLQLTEGETFEVGKKEKKKYKVEKIYDDEATFSGNDKTYYARPDFKHRGKLKTEEEMRAEEVETNRSQN